jgi:1-phosphatidylinositol phosphodiesterase
MGGRDDWCSALRPTMNLTELAIPGTHDSAAWTHHENFPSSTPATWAHRKSITEQLELGVRALDLRVGWRLGWGGYDVGMYHGPVDLSISLQEVLTEVNTWLASHADEFVILIFQQQGKLGTKGALGKKWDISSDVDKMVKDTFGARLFNFKGTRKTWPLLETLRGKVLAMSRMQSAPSGFCDVRTWLQHDNTTGAEFAVADGLKVYLQDRYKGLSSATMDVQFQTSGDYDKKLEMVERTAARAIEGHRTDHFTLTINHLSHSSIKWQPWTIGKVMNEMLRRSRFKICGLLMIDDADADTVDRIVGCNPSSAS